MYDSTTAGDIPADAEMVAGYIDGRFQWSEDDWARFPNAVKVRIAISAATNAGHVLDVEWGDASPEDVPGWVTMRRAVGADPSAYVNRSNWQAAKDACAAAGVAEPHWWLAAYGIGPQIVPGTVATQYANDDISGGHYDLSAVADYWPGVDMTPDEVKALIAEYAQSLETSELLPMKNRLDVLETAANKHIHDTSVPKPTL